MPHIRCILGRHQYINFIIRKTSLDTFKEFEDMEILVGIPLRICICGCGRAQKQVTVGGKHGLRWITLEGNEIYKAISKGLSSKMIEMRAQIESVEKSEKQMLPDERIPKVQAAPNDAFSELVEELKKWIDDNKEKAE